ncbi:MAG: class I SAM-dependent methyltransferase [Neisseria sp.]|nr:class I SAM-dependent methyltransferase [Neisseria sp.]
MNGLSLYAPSDLSSGEPVRLEALIAPFGVTLAFRQPEGPYFLWFDGEKIVLRGQNPREKVVADFVSGSLLHRTRQPQGELLLRALNVRENKLIWDATAGLGKDALVMAAAGAQVRLFERHPIPAVLLADGLARAAQHEHGAVITARMSLTFGEIGNDMVDDVRPDAIYLDPMFPERRKSALVKKEMRYFQAAVGEDADGAALLETARGIALRRIVVKRPRHGEYLGGRTPAYQYSGKSTRFDVYLPT